MRITGLRALEVLDSRGQPTLRVTMTLQDGRTVTAGVPAGASKGSKEAVELRDGEPGRYRGRGVRQAVSAVNGPLAEALVGHDWYDLATLDDALRRTDGTDDKSRLGANSLIGVSLAAARGLGMEADLPLYRFLAPSGATARLPVPHFNVINGGAHAPNPLDFQEFMIAPLGAPTLSEAIRAGAEIYGALRERLAQASLAGGVGDEGGFAPEISDPADACQFLVEAIELAGYRRGPSGVMLALDPAANGFWQPGGGYRVAGASLSSNELVEMYGVLADRFPIWSIEDGFAEADPAGWRNLSRTLGDRLQIVGDDIFVTSAGLIDAGIRDGLANAALIKPNQAGTVTETVAALETCRRCGVGAMLSHRSGETADAFIADLAVASGCGQIKSGAPARGERVAKYNRLLEIAALEPAIPYGLPRNGRLSA